MYDDDVNVSVLEGKTLTEVRNLGDELIFVTTDDEEYKMYHMQDCCESVNLEEVTGDLNDLVGTPILKACEDTNREGPELDMSSYESYTWTFYNFRTIKGSVTLRWLGSSNGYYSESVDFVRIN